MIGWRREDPDYNPDSVTCPRNDLSWLGERWWVYRHRWQSEVYSLPMLDGGHALLSIDTDPARKVSLRDAPFSFHVVPLGIREGAYIHYPDGIKNDAELCAVWYAKREAEASCPDPRARIAALYDLGLIYYSSGPWDLYKTKRLRGISKFLDVTYKEARRKDRAEKRAARVALAEKEL